MTSQPITAEFQQLEAAAADATVKARRVAREADLAKNAVAERNALALNLAAEQGAGRDVAKPLRAAEKDLADAQARAAEPWEDRVHVARRTAELRQADVTAFAEQHRAELWAERALEAHALVAEVEETAANLDAALGRLQAFAGESDRLCSVSGGRPRMDMPVIELGEHRRAARDAAAALRAPLPLQQQTATILPEHDPDPEVREQARRDIIEVTP